MVGGVKEAADQCSGMHKAITTTGLCPPGPASTDERVADRRITIESSQAEKEASPVALRFNEGKVRWDLLDATALEGVAAVLAFGTKKYSAENWRKGLSWKSTLRSLESHLQELKRGEDIDPESGLPHIDHLGCNWMFFSNYQKMGIGEDDRYKSAEVIEKNRQAWVQKQLEQFHNTTKV